MKRLKYLTSINPSLPRDCIPLSSDIVSFLPMERIGENGSLDLSEVRPAYEISKGYTAILDGDLVIAKITPCFENGKGALCHGLQGGIGFGTTELIVLRAKPQSDPRFLYWLTRSHEFRNWGEAEMLGSAGQKRVTEEFVSNFRTIDLSRPEQCRIAAYLDEQTGKIDRLMDMRRRQMALLKEQRAALIQQAVTRGLNPNAPMKDSGLPWLGEIPAHWVLKKLKSLCSTTKGFAFKSELFVDEGIPVVRASEIKDCTVVDCSTFIRPDIALNYRQVTLCSGDILISTVGSKAEILESAVGQVGVVPPELDGALLNQNTVRLELACPKEVSQAFLFNILRTDTFRKHLDINAHGTANQASLSLVDILSFPAPLPPLVEQIAIIEFIDCQCQQIDRAFEAYARQLTLLAEYRAALIHECVTGQRTVPEVANA